MATLLVGPTRTYTTIQAAINVTSATNDNPASRAAMDVILIDPGTYTETLDLRASWLLPVILRGANPANRPIIASTGAAQAVRADSVYRGTAVGELTLEDLEFSGWTGAGNGVIYITTSGLVVRRCKFTGCTGARAIRTVSGSASRYGLVDSCEFVTSGATSGLIIGNSAYTQIKNCKAVCPTNVPFYSDLGGATQFVEHNSVLGTWNSGGNTDVITVSGGTARGNVVQNLGTGARYGIYEWGAGSYTENVFFGTFSTMFFGTDGGGNQNANPLFVNTGTGDLTLQLSSPAIRSLARSANTLLDIQGDSRSDPTDAGAYEMVLDVTPPTITGWARTSKTTIVLTFSEDLNEVSAETAGNYTTSPSQSVTAVLSPANVVTLTLSPGVDTVRLTVANVTDLAGNVMASWSREIGWFSGDSAAGLSVYAVAADGSSVGYLPDWDPMPSGVGSEATLERLVFVSLFSDARIEDDETPTDGTTDRRGWWADTDEDDNTGSRLWHLQGRAGVSAREYEDAIKSALAWMVVDRVCTAVTSRAQVSNNRVDVEVELTLVAGDVKRIAFPDLWSTHYAS